MLKKIRIFFELIKFEHTVFALPFAYLGMLLAQKRWPSLDVFFWVTVAMAAARTAGMTLNRIIDRAIDQKNPRTRNRALVTGEFAIYWARIWVFIALCVFFFSAYELNPLCLKLAPLAIVPLLSYHYVKRFSFVSHFTLGLVLGIAPMGGWIAATGAFSWVAVFLSMAVLFWVAGFDIIYSLQDLDFDKAHGLHSIPARFGENLAVKISGVCHLTSVGLLLLFGLFWQMGTLYWTGIVVTVALLCVEHGWASEGDHNKINAAFFTINGWIGILLLIFTFLDIFR